MTRRAGSADLPLHHGRVPAWLGRRMSRLGAVIAQAIVLHYGRDEFLRRLAHPFWFQSFVDAPHAAIEGRSQGEIVNLTDRRADASRRGQLRLLRDLGPDRIVRELTASAASPAPPPDAPFLPHLVMPAHHDVRPKDVMIR